MNKARKKFVLYAMAAVLALLTVLLGIINGVNFTMASEDADHLTQILAESGGAFGQTISGQGRMNFRNGRPVGGGVMGPASPETASSLRHFTAAVDENGQARLISYAMTAVSQEDALAWAQTLTKEGETGWTGRVYRYRVYERDGQTFVTVIDQSRELLPCYRILTISLIGLAAGMIISSLILIFIGKKLFQPLEEGDRRQKRFIAQVEQEFKVPLTVISADTEVWEKESGETEQTRSINRQVKRMTALVKDLGSLAVFGQEDLAKEPLDLSALARAAADRMKPAFEEKGVALTQHIADGVSLQADSDKMNALVRELLENALKFAKSHAEISLTQENGRTLLTMRNDALLPDGPADQAFDRFTRLDNAQGVPGAGLGLTHVKDAVQAHNGRAGARVEKGEFIIKISF